MLSVKYEIKIAIDELAALKESIDKNLDDNIAQTAKYLEIEQVCRSKKDKWKRLNGGNCDDGTIGLLDVDLLECADRVLATYNSGSSGTFDGVVSNKIVSILSVLFSCLSDSTRLGAAEQLVERCVTIIDCILDALCGNDPDHSDDQHPNRRIVLEDDPPSLHSHHLEYQPTGVYVAHSLESIYYTLEACVCGVVPLLMLERKVDGLRTKCTTAALALLKQAAMVGNTKIVAKITSTLFEEIHALFSAETTYDLNQLAVEMLRILSDESNDGNCTTESRCVGVYCLVKPMREIALKTNRARWDEQIGDILQVLIQRYIISDKGLVRKCGRSLLSLVIEGFNGDCESKAFADFLTLLEAFELKQLHVVKPAFGLLDGLVKHCQAAVDAGVGIERKLMRFDDVVWLRLAFYNAMHHVNAFVVKWAIGKYFELDSHSLPSVAGYNCEFLFDVVLPTLDRSDAYYRFSEENCLPKFLENMERFLRGLIPVYSPAVFWRQWLRIVTDYRMASVPLFYISHVLSRVSNDYYGPSIFHASDSITFRLVFWEFRHIPQPFVRAAVQEANLKILFNLCDWSETTITKLCSSVLSLVPAPILRQQAIRWSSENENDICWLLAPCFIGNLLKIASSTNNCSTHIDSESVTRSLDALRALVAIWYSATVQRSNLNQMLQLLTKHLPRMSADNFEQFNSNDWTSLRLYSSLTTPFMETCPGEFFRVIHSHSPNVIARHADALIWQICHDRNVDIVTFKISFNWLLVLVSSEEACLNTYQREHIIRRLHSEYCNCQIGNIRRYYLLQTLSIIMENIRSPLANIGQFAPFSTRLVLDMDDILTNSDDRFEPSDWSRMLSEYAAAKWRCLLVVLNAVKSNAIEVADAFEWKKLGEAALNALDIISSAEDVHYVMQCLVYILPKILPSEHTLASASIKKMLLVCYEQRKCDQFVPTVRHCCFAIFQPGLFFSDYDDVLNELQSTVDSFMLEIENPSLACCISEAINHAITEMKEKCFDSAPLSTGHKFLLKTLAAFCCFGIVLRKDQRVLYDAAELIKEFGSDVYKCVGLIESDNLACQKTRFYAFHGVLRIIEEFSAAKDAIVDYLVELACEKLLELTAGATKNGYFANSQCHRVRTRAVQLLLLVEPFVRCPEVAFRLQQFTLRYLTEQNQQPSVRLLLEWLMTRLNLRFLENGLLDEWWEAEDYMVSKRAGTLCTWMEVLMHTGLCMAPDKRRRHALQCVKRWLPWCTAQNFTLRCCAQTCLRRLWKEEQNTQNPRVLENEWKFLEEFLTPTIIFDKEQKNNTKNVEKASKDFYFSVFNAERDYTLQTIFHSFPRLCFLPVDEFIPVEFWRSVANSSDQLYNIRIENATNELDKGNVFVWRDRAQAALAEEVSHVASYESLQTKTNLFTGANDMVVDLDRESKAANRDGLVVVATLVDRPTNLGGLCRTCEIFGVEEYAVSTFRVGEDFEFQVLSVSSEKWVKMIEVKLADLKTYLKQKQSDGYTIVAVEQTTTSCRLTDYRFPTKTLLLLGNEKEGIPVDLLQYVDVCVEIPQIGHTRSLNVHVAGALLIWEYTKQQRFAQRN